ncbi:unnamed protein product [Acanthoscelides obtectus]|uniref:Uncharacterized protein n=1 Tax=Acanthoscelides obtectus TaxID=200917 RepID=A0A9P0PZQ8_ACAOB|nr:unnamed protein product [Acanthoscelides obtectus]CAK1645319.1 Transmembrane and TPR repeat-containing protein CG4341 [Acanthoscelides obtectus]
MGGFRPWGYHLGNILLHCLATALLIKVARQVLPRSKLKVGTTVAGLVFASHPVHTEAVAGVVGRADLAACNFYFLSLLTYMAHVRYRDATVYAQVCTKSKIGEAKRYRRLVVALPKSVSCAGCQWTGCRGHNGMAKSCDREVAIIMKVNSKDSSSETYRQWFYMALTLVFAAAAMLSKETGITVLGLCFVYDIVYSSYNTKTLHQNPDVCLLKN